MTFQMELFKIKLKFAQEKTLKVYKLQIYVFMRWIF